MKRISLIVGMSALFAWGVTSALGGCGGSTASDVAANGPDSSSGGSSGSSGDNGSSGSSGDNGSSGSSGSPDGSTVTDAGHEGGSSGSASNPGKVTCGASECNTNNQQCCQTLNDAGCIDQGNTCQGARLSCDESADCKQGESCCFALGGGGGGGIRARCQNACQSPSSRVCKTNADCGDAGTCAEKTCTFGASSFKLRTCGDLPGCN